MIRCIVAIDENRGMANDQGIPWNLPTDRQYFRNQTTGGNVLMGYGTYVEFAKSWKDRQNYVAVGRPEKLRPGFKPVLDAREFLKDFKGGIWVIGGAGLLEQTLDLMDELYITQLKGDFHCTKFLPEYEESFKLISSQPWQQENGITFRFEVWARK